MTLTPDRQRQLAAEWRELAEGLYATAAELRHVGELHLAERAERDAAAYADAADNLELEAPTDG